MTDPQPPTSRDLSGSSRQQRSPQPPRTVPGGRALRSSRGCRRRQARRAHRLGNRGRARRPRRVGGGCRADVRGKLSNNSSDTAPAAPARAVGLLYLCGGAPRWRGRRGERRGTSDRRRSGEEGEGGAGAGGRERGERCHRT